MKIAFYTLGCKVNQYETDVLKEKAESLGFELTDFDDKNADVYVINSCSVTNMSDRKTRQMVSKAKSNNKDAVVALLGCSVENIRNDDELFETKADILIGNEDKLNLFEIIDTYIKKKKVKLIKISDIEKAKRYRNEYSLKKGYDVREAVKIEDGCDNFCSYCIIPYVRGRVRSRNKEEILTEIQNLVKCGVKEVVIVGIEIASYGKDLENTNIFDLLDDINNIPGLERIRLGSLLPTLLTKENIQRLKSIDKLCEHFHISMQSAEDNILKKMNRKYTSDNLIEIVKMLRQYFVNPYIASDVIVGFPGETDKMFKTTMDNICKMNLSEIHVFKYSKRKYTVAETMENQIDGDTKNKRSEELLEISKINKQKYLEEYIGKSEAVLFESYKNKINTGYTKNYMKVIVKGNENLCGTIQDVDIISLEKENLIGKRAIRRA